MKNFSDENNIIDKNGKIFPQSDTKKTKIDINKQVIITESSQISNNLNKITENNIIISNNIRIIIIIVYFVIIIWAETFYRDYLFKKSIPIQEYFQKDDNNTIFFENM